MDTGNLNYGNAARLQEGYFYDALGSVNERTLYWGTAPAQIGFDEKFTYDDLNRLETSTIQPYLSQAAQTQTFTYDAAGNLTSKTNVGNNGIYSYPAQGANAIRPHAVQSIGGIAGTFNYDANGNLTSGAGRNITWTSFDMPQLIGKNNNSAVGYFTYGTEHQRTRQSRTDKGVSTQIIYAGAQEVELKDSGITIKTYWPGGIGVEIDRTGLNATSTSELNWTHTDSLGSVVAISDQNGNLKEKLAYDAWGKRRNLTDSATPEDSLDGVTDNKGYTGHEMLDQLDLVHMNGRVYDPLTAKFLSGDPLIQDPMNGQSYNRYSYVMNNPTNLTDPTGFCGEGKTELPGSIICKPILVGIENQKGGVDVYKQSDTKTVKVDSSTAQSTTGGKGTPSVNQPNSGATNKGVSGVAGFALGAGKEIAATGELLATAQSPGAASIYVANKLMGVESQFEQHGDAEKAGGYTVVAAQMLVGAGEAISAVKMALGLGKGGTELAVKTAGEIGKDIVQWGRGQTAEEVAKTVARNDAITPKLVQDMVKQGLERGWVEKQLSQYTKAYEEGGKKLLNEQLVPRIELMQNILKNWIK